MTSTRAVNCFAHHTQDGERLLVSLKNFAPESGVTLSSDSIEEIQRILDRYKQKKQTDRPRPFDDGASEDVPRPVAPLRPAAPSRPAAAPRPRPQSGQGAGPGAGLEPGPEREPELEPEPAEEEEEDNDPDSRMKKDNRKKPLVEYEPPGEISQAASDEPKLCRSNKIAIVLAIVFGVGLLILIASLLSIGYWKERQAKRDAERSLSDAYAA